MQVGQAQAVDHPVDAVVQVPGMVPLCGIERRGEPVGGTEVALGDGLTLGLHLSGQGPNRPRGVGEDLLDSQVEGERGLLVEQPDDARCPHRPGVRLVDPGCNSQQGRLAGAVLTDQGGDLAGGHREGDVGEHPTVRERA